jgi:acyl-CoA synthetase (AMP-forming)/AMP-acid ligase II
MCTAMALPAAVIIDGRKISPDELDADLRIVAGGLSRRGVGVGDRVVVSLPNSYEFVVVHLALDLLGAVTINLPTAFRREIGQVVRMVDARLCVLHAVENPRLYGDLRQYVTLADGLGALGDASAGAAAAERRAEDKIWLAFTSGSTGTPRAAVHTRASLDASTRAMAGRYGLGPEDTLLVAAPVGHAIGFCYGVRLACASGARLVLQRSWDAERALATIDETGATFAAIPTPFLVDLLDARARPQSGTLRHLLVGGAPVAPEQIDQADDKFGPGIVSRYYGASECGAVLTSPPGASDEARLSTDGMPMPGMEIRVVGADGEEVAEGDSGEMLVRGPQVALGYWANNDSDGQFLPDGWFATRDLVSVDPAGYYRATGRIKDIIFRGAVNISPREVEEAVASHPEVGFVVVFGRSDRRLGERIVAAYTPRNREPDTEEIREWLKGSGLARSKWPDEVIAVTEFPRLESGKIDRGRVRDDLLSRNGHA